MAAVARDERVPLVARILLVVHAQSQAPDSHSSRLPGLSGRGVSQSLALACGLGKYLGSCNCDAHGRSTRIVISDSRPLDLLHGTSPSCRGTTHNIQLGININTDAEGTTSLDSAEDLSKTLSTVLRAARRARHQVLAVVASRAVVAALLHALVDGADKVLLDDASVTDILVSQDIHGSLRTTTLAVNSHAPLNLGGFTRSFTRSTTAAATAASW